MRHRGLITAWIFAFGMQCSFALAATRECLPPESAGKHVNKDVCVTGHVYDVIELSDGTRFLDLCSPGTSDDQCRFTVVSMNADRKEVGDLARYREQEIQIRGIVRPFNLRSEIILSRERQLHGGSEKFRPNPVLMKGFSAEDSQTAFHDPASRSSNHKSSFSKRH